jgi:hypothetical protein
MHKEASYQHSQDSKPIPYIMMASIESQLSSALENTGVRVATPSCNDYQELITRWSDAAERKAVRIFPVF